ncbi:hypothetical protein BSKO_06269 [Bryopsis sp. KO-2023]|nr:hypothetical protein BSKO_06269 [Bryopsis sp. KO-2023]
MASTGKQPSPKQAVDFFTLIQKLKITKRTGWVKRQVEAPESVADHMYRMGMMALVATDSNVDVSKCVKMALIHDVAESLVGDITPYCGVSEEEKHQLESNAIAEIKETLGNDTHAADEIEEIWKEYESATTPEARFVKDLDKLEMVLQAHEYESDQGKDLSKFFKSTEGRFQTDTGKAWAAEVVSRRNKQK